MTVRNRYPSEYQQGGDLEAYLKALTDRIRRHPGEFILIIERQEVSRPGPGGCFAPDNYYDRHVYRTLGILNQNVTNFELTSTTTALPTSRIFSEKRSGQRSRRSGLQEGEWNLGLASFLLPLAHHLGKIIPWACTNHELYEGETALELVIGNAAVRSWFSWSRDIDYMFYPERAVVWLQEAAEKLGHPLADTPELDARRASQRQAILQAIWELNDQAAVERQELAGLSKAHRTTGIYQRGGAVGLVETADDLRVVSMPHSRRLDEFKRRMQRLLGQAKELGLADHPLVMAFDQIYTAG